MSWHRTRLLLIAAAAALVWLCPASAARAQFSYGYDSWIYGGTAPAQLWYSGFGYSSMYVDPSTAFYQSGTAAPPRPLAPYEKPPFGSFGRANGVSPYAAPAPPAVAAPAGPPPRRGLIRRFARPR
jgi:hypothetical protein